METLTLKTTAKFELIDLTDEINSKIVKVKSGILLAFTPHTTAGLICNENEPGLKSDILNVLESFETHAPSLFGQFKHDHQEGNAHAHIISALTGGARSFIIENNQLALGPWQSVMFLEMDGPRERKVLVKILSDKG